MHIMNVWWRWVQWKGVFLLKGYWNQVINYALCKNLNLKLLGFFFFNIWFVLNMKPICLFMILDLLAKTGSESYIVILHLRVDNNAILLFQKLTTCPQNLNHDIRDNERKGNHAISMQWHIKLYIKIWKFDILFLFLAYKHGVTPIYKKLCCSYYSK